MAEINAKDVMKLKDLTNAGMMECKKALVDANGDLDAAIALLRERSGAKGAAPKSTEMKEGLVAGKISEDGKTGVIIRLGCQTDFVARNEMFQKLLADVLELAFKNPVTTPADVHALPYPDGSGRTTDQVIKELIGGSIKENLAVTGLARYTTANGQIGKYIHHNGKVGTLVQVDGASDDAVRVLLGEIAMHVTAGMPFVPMAVTRDQLDQEVVAKEKAAASEGIDPKKPKEIIEKIVAGKLEKFFADQVLVDQPFVKDEKMKVRELVAQTAKASGAPISVIRFARFKVGEG
jgi:elongation factor Ts